MNRYLKGMTVTLAALVLAACGGLSSSTTTLSSITINGATAVTVDYESTFNFKTGVTALGNDGLDYTSSITLSSTSTAVNTTTGALDTTKTGLHAVRYTVTVGSVTAQQWRNVTVSQPAKTGLLINPDFAQGPAGWNDPSVVYIADGAAMTLTGVDGELKAEVTAGANFFTPRFGQMNIAFEKDKTYQVSFQARSSVTKEIALQVGELLTSAPWFTDFLPAAEPIIYRTITTTMATYSYKFTMNADNPRGGILFGLGKIRDQQINATMYFDNISIVESTVDPDVTAPIFSGVQPSVNVLVDSTYDPLAGVTALDAVDGDLTDDIVVEIYNSADQKVNAVVTTAPAVFTVEYSVEDAAGNEATAQTTVNVVSLLFKDENLLTNGSFTTAIGAEWTYWQQDWGSAPVVVRNQDTTAGTYSLNITGGGDAVWAIQFANEGVDLVEGTTYRFSVKASATAARKISVGIGYSFGDNQWNEYARKNGIEIGTTLSTQEFIFTVAKASAEVKVVLELGTQEGFANGTIVLDEVRLQRLDAKPLVTNSDLNMTGWRHFVNDWEGTVVSSGIVSGEYKLTITKAANLNNADNWKLQILQDNAAFGEANDDGRLALVAGKSYTLSFDMYASKAISVTTFVGAPGVWVNYATEATRVASVTTSKQTFNIPVSTVGATLNGKEKLSFEFGTQFTNFETGNEFVAIDNVVLKDGSTPTTSVVNGDMTAVLGGHQFFTENGGTMTRGTNGGASIVVPELGGAAYQPHYYYVFPTLNKGTFNVKIVLTSSVTRDLRFNVILPDAGYASILENNFVDLAVVADTAYTFTVSFTTTTTLTNVKLELDFGTLGGSKTSLPGTFLLSEVLVYQVINS